MKSFKTELILNNKQKSLASKHSGVARHAWNWGLEQTQNALDNKELLPSSITLHKRLVAEVKKENPWYYEVSKYSPQQALRNLETSWKRCFKKIGKQPRYKKKGTQDSFYLEGKMQIKGNKIKLPSFGWVKAHENLPEVLKGISGIANVTISLKADRWFVSFKTNTLIKETKKISDCVGVDLGVKTLATCSDGTTFENPKAYRQNKKKLAKAQRALARKVKGSNNRTKAKKKLQKMHYRIGNIRKNAIHQITSYLSKNHRQIVLEGLNVSGMMKNHKLASAVADCGFYELRRQLEYKCSWYGCEITYVDRFFPSSKICSNCGCKKEHLSLSERIFNCSDCGFSIDRDLNASINLKEMRKELPEVLGDVMPAEMKALADGSAICETVVKETGIKQQLGTNVQNCVSF
jgi:putative transposase